MTASTLLNLLITTDASKIITSGTFDQGQSDPCLIYGIIQLQHCLVPRHLSLAVRKWWTCRGGREGERKQDIWQIMFSRWQNVQWQMITQFSKRSIDLLVLRIYSTAQMYVNQNMHIICICMCCKYTHTLYMRMSIPVCAYKYTRMCI